MDLDQNRFETFDELYLYCYRVAGTVGLMMMPIMGTAEGYTYEEALEPALALGVAPVSYTHLTLPTIYSV